MPLVTPRITRPLFRWLSNYSPRKGVRVVRRPDALLAELDRSRINGGAEVFILGEHVDYWNYLGWKDRVSSPDLSHRQRRYAQHFGLDSVYTPQMVIDGRYQIVGNDRAGVQQKIALAAQKSIDVEIVLSVDGDRLSVDARSINNSAADLLLAVTENGLSTSVANGETGGRILRHSGVVRQLRTIGSLNHGRLSPAVALKLASGWNPENLRVIVFAQKPTTGEITGASAVEFRRMTTSEAK